jgi:uncharacterized protein YpmB
MRKPLLFILVILIVGVACATYLFNKHLTPVAVSGSSDVPTKQLAIDYVNSHDLLKEVTDAGFTPIRFIAQGTGGGGFMKVQGIDQKGQEKAYWFGYDKNHKIQVVNSTLLSDGLSKEQIYSLFKQKGITGINQLFIGPTDLKNPPKWRMAWYVVYTKDGHENDVILDFKTGENLTDNPF